MFTSIHYSKCYPFTLVIIAIFSNFHKQFLTDSYLIISYLLVNGMPNCGWRLLRWQQIRHGSVNRKTEPISDILKNRHRHRRRYFKNRKPTKNNRKNRYSRLFSYLPKPLFCLCLRVFIVYRPILYSCYRAMHFSRTRKVK